MEGANERVSELATVTDNPFITLARFHGLKSKSVKTTISATKETEHKVINKVN